MMKKIIQKEIGQKNITKGNKIKKQLGKKYACYIL